MSQMPVYKGNEFEILKIGYQEHAEYLRAMNIFDWRVVSGFMTIQLILGGWFAGHPSKSLWLSFGVIIIDAALYSCCTMILRISEIRRGETMNTMKNINEAFGLNAVGIYLPERAINSPRPRGHRYIWYYVSMLIGAFGASFVLVWNLLN